MKLSQGIRWIVAVGLIASVTTGCSMFKTKQASQVIDPPALASSETANPTSQDAITTDTAVLKTPITVFFKDGKGFIAPVTFQVAKVEGIAKKSLEYMVQDGIATDLLPHGFTALLPKGTIVKQLNIKNKLATVDFSKEFKVYAAADERKIMEAITWTLTGFPSIDKVEIRVEGKALREMPVSGTPLDEPLSRALGINIERSEGVDLGNSSPVTLYFLNQTADNMTYYVPVTRMVKRTDDIAKTAITELIKGPLLKSSLASVLSPDTQLISVKQSGDHSLITVNFNGILLDADKKVPDEALQSVVLSLTENTGASKVQIMINGSTKVSGSSDQSYSKPVSRPLHLNALKL